MKLEQILITIIGLLIVSSCSTRDDKVFSASDELHSIVLYEQDNKFDLVYNGLNTATGKYSLKGDTILLIYTENQIEEFYPNKKLTGKILFDKKSNSVKSIDDRMKFCANVNFDKRNKN